MDDAENAGNWLFEKNSRYIHGVRMVRQRGGYKMSITGYTFEQLIDVGQVRQLLESHCRLSGMAYALFDNNENDIVSAGWQEICTRFHRVHPFCSARCRESDAYIKAHLNDVKNDYLEYRCGNGMIDVAMPIIIEGRHLATFFAGQFFCDDDPPDRAFFLDQAREFCFDPEDYIAALELTPVFSREYVRDNVVFLHAMVRVLAESGLKSLKLSNEIEQRRLFEERYAFSGFALDQVREAAFLIDVTGHFHYVNQAACRSLGYSRKELLGMAIPDIDPDFPVEKLPHNHELLFEQGLLTFETRHRTRDGRIFPVEITSNLFERDGVTYSLALSRDISERKRAELELRASRDYLENIINAIADPVFVKDAGHRLVLVNDAECALAGSKREELLGKTDYDFFPREEVDLFWKIDDQVLASGEPNVNEELITDASGLTRTIVTHKSRYIDPLGNRFVVGVIRDITERKRSESVNMSRLRLLQFAVTHGMDELIEAILDEAEALTGSLIGFYHFFEADRKCILRQGWSTRTKAEFCKAEGKGEHYDVSVAGVWFDCIRERRPVIHNDYASLPHRRGMPPGHAPVVRELLVPVFRGDTIVAILGVGNKPQDYTSEDLEAVSFLADLTWEIIDRKRGEEALLVKRSQLAALAAELSLAEERERQSIAAVLHDHIGQTLLLGRIKLGTLAEEQMPEPQRKMVRETKELLDQVTHDIHTLTVQMNPPILAAVGLEAALEWLGRRMEEDFGLFVEFDDDLKEKPLLDEVRSVMYQCGRELLINAAKHAGSDHARIVVARDDNRYRLTVEDDGVGFDPAALVPDASRDSRFGLFSIQIRMERMGGSVVFESAPGEGSRMTLLAPLALDGVRGSNCSG